jgi:photosystem II stability/assembly factor-like uncharacterized protein
MKNYIIFFFTIYLMSCAENNEKNEEKPTNYSLVVEELNLDVDKFHFRGLYILDSNTVWISGTNGIVIHSFDGGKTWKVDSISEAKGLDFRDVHALNDSTALVLSAGSPGKIFKTSNKGNTWKEVYANYDSLIFYDGMDFWNDKEGIVFGDPIHRKMQMLYTNDGGSTWTEIDSAYLPKTLAIEAAFAASGTGIITLNNNKIYIGTGGEQARFITSNDKGKTWQYFSTPILQGTSSKGIYSMAFKDEHNGVAVGGNWENIECDSSKMYTNDGGKTWHLSKGNQHYRSCVTYVKDEVYISTGTSGTDISYDAGKSWQFLDSVSLNAIQFFPNSLQGVGVGSKGKIVKLTLKKI